MADETTKMYFCLRVLAVLFIVSFVSADIIIQGQNCGSQQEPLVVRMTNKDEDWIVSHAGTDYYQPDKDCIVTIIGKPYYQFQIEILTINIDSRSYVSDFCKGRCCNDYLKMFNSYRVDNARRFPTIPWRGLCGSEIPKKSTFITTQNYVTIQFNVDTFQDNMRGFSLRIIQYLRRYSGNVNPESGYIGGWNDGTLNEIQLAWNEQESIPGDYIPGGTPDYGQEQNGVTCYECYRCRIDYFNPSSAVDMSTVRTGCFVCSKEWQDAIASANRKCYSRSQYNSLLLTLKDTSTGSGTVSDFRGCRKFMNIQGIFMNYCMCDDKDKCNHAVVLEGGRMSFFFGTLLSLVLIRYV